jgi:hypothetical protein
MFSSWTVGKQCYLDNDAGAANNFPCIALRVNLAKLQSIIGKSSYNQDIITYQKNIAQ